MHNCSLSEGYLITILKLLEANTNKVSFYVYKKKSLQLSHGWVKWQEKLTTVEPGHGCPMLRMPYLLESILLKISVKRIENIIICSKIYRKNNTVKHTGEWRNSHQTPSDICLHLNLIIIIIIFFIKQFLTKIMH